MLLSDEWEYDAPLDVESEIEVQEGIRVTSTAFFESLSCDM